MNLQELLSRSVPVFLAPMAGVTDAPFRNLVYKFGATAVVSEMVSSEALIRNSKKTFRRLTNENNKSINIIQIVGHNPENMAESAVINESLGADVIDINMGCPARKITSNESGSALMKNESLAVRIAEAVVKAVKIPVTLKMRLGWDFENINCFSLAKKFEDIGIQMLAIHCRTRNQMYTGKADWAALKSMRDTVKIPYLCNGDIKNADDARTAMSLSSSNGVMIGRAALGKPWLLNQVMQFLSTNQIIEAPSIEERFKIVMEHFQDTLDFYGQEHGIRVFRKHFCWYSTGMTGASLFRQTINQCEDLNFIKGYVENFYTNHFKAML